MINAALNPRSTTPHSNPAQIHNLSRNKNFQNKNGSLMKLYESGSIYNIKILPYLLKKSFLFIIFN
jgi:hypothetical protein